MTSSTKQEMTTVKVDSSAVDEAAAAAAASTPLAGGAAVVGAGRTKSINSHVEPHFGSAEVVRDVIIG